MKVVLIGSGNVATLLSPLLKKNGHKIIQVYSRTKTSAQKLAKKTGCRFTTSVKGIIETADLYLIALSDDAIAPFIKKLSFTPKLIVHTSGSVGTEVFGQKIVNYGVLYPLQSFSKNSKHTPAKIPFCIEGSNPSTQSQLKKIAKSLSPLVYQISSQERVFLHLAAVFINNFPNYLYALAEKILSRKKINFNILFPLMEETIKNAIENSPHDIQTGPARRGDIKIINKHLRLLSKEVDMKEIYRILSKNIQKEYRKQ